MLSRPGAAGTGKHALRNRVVGALEGPAEAMLQIRCACGHQFDVSRERLGKPLVCQSCKSALRVVAPDGRVGPGDPSGILYVRAGSHRVGEQIFLAGELPIQIGKLPGSDIRLQSNSVSRTHCRLIRGETGWRIEDEDSTNGTFLNGKRITNGDLRHGDRITIGGFRFKYLSPSDTAATALPVSDRPEHPKPK